mmetsp:Transcript_38183/g.75004  ORF Transcript_38183/g.75004 Transcript_38183/m.75004 type:complete len:106 (+) Transcript_38183:3043-3360(+)
MQRGRERKEGRQEKRIMMFIKEETNHVEFFSRKISLPLEVFSPLLSSPSLLLPPIFNPCGLIIDRYTSRCVYCDDVACACLKDSQKKMRECNVQKSRIESAKRKL